MEVRASATARPRLGIDALAALATFALWLVCRPYRGVRHDGLLYVGQVLHRLMPERFASDPFFAFGSQDRWSLFSPLMAPIVSHWGIAGPLIAMLCLCQLAFVVACWLLVRDWPSRTLRWAAVLAVVVLPHTYGGLGAFSYAEPFLTARSLAEPLALLALWPLMSRRLLPALVLAAAAAAFHPLMTAPILLVGWAWLALERRAWLWLGLLLLLPAVAALAGIAPFDTLWRRFDPEWFQGVHLSNANAFVANYQILDWMPALFDAVVLALFMRRAPTPALARLAKATLITVPVVLLAWGLGADVLHDVFLTQIQLWRIFWPLHLFAVLALPVVVADAWARGWAGRWVAVAACLAGLATMSNWPTGWLCMLWFGAALLALHRAVPISRGTALLAIAGSGAAMIAISVRVTRHTMEAVVGAPDRFASHDFVLVVLGLPLVSAALAVGALLALRRGTAATAAMAAACVALTAFGLTAWDQRSPWQKYLEDAPSHEAAVFDAQIPTRATVYWQVDMIEAWLLGRRGDYFSPLQGAGLLFNRDSSLQFTRRQDLLDGISLQHQLCEEVDALTRRPGAPPAVCRVSPEIFAETCDKPRHPDFFVFAEPMLAPPIAEWHAPAGISAENRAFYLYRCPPVR